MRAIAAILVLLAATPAWSRAPRIPCPTGRFLTSDAAHVVADVTPPAVETIVLEDTAITIDPGLRPRDLQASAHAQRHGDPRRLERLHRRRGR